ncbi:hypothetical protein GJAV_G00109150 [Gymnothorax javanicus]|nr:hypothetical protein GJAV_G00109150 [Gymnothorax javanicus]
MKKVPTPPVKEATSPHRVRKVAPTCADKKVALPNAGRKVLPPKPPTKEEGVMPNQQVRKVATACHPQKVALPNLTREETPPRPAQDKVPPPCSVDKVAPRFPGTDNMQERAAQVMLAQLRESGEFFALKALRKDFILGKSLLEYVKVEKRVLILAAENPFLIYLHSTFQTEVAVLMSIFFNNIVTHLLITHLHATLQVKLMYHPILPLNSTLETKLIPIRQVCDPQKRNDTDLLVVSVCNDAVHYPDSLNQESKDLLEKLLEEDPTLRLGVAEDIRAHPFFDVID